MSLNAATPDLEWPDTLESAATLVRAMNKPPFWGRLAAEALFTASLGHLEQLRRPCRHVKPGPNSVPLFPAVPFFLRDAKDPFALLVVTAPRVCEFWESDHGGGNEVRID